MPQAACYVTGHGFGHAARCMAVVEALLERSSVQITIHSTVPAWFFRRTLGPRCQLRATGSLDPGVVQDTALDQDLPRTLAAWEAACRDADSWIDAEAERLRRGRTRVVLVDSSPFACEAGRRAGCTVLLMANFTWDWILEGYAGSTEGKGLAEIARRLRDYYRGARLLWLPLSPEPAADLFASVQHLALVARRPLVDAARVRELLGVEPGARLVLLAFGGVGLSGVHTGRLAQAGLWGVWDQPANARVRTTRDLPLHFPDLVPAVDLVVTKPGFSIIADAVQSRVPLLYARREGFREAPLLESWLASHWPSAAIERTALQDGSWVDAARELLDNALRPAAVPTDGAIQVATIVSNWL